MSGLLIRFARDLGSINNPPYLVSQFLGIINCERNKELSAIVLFGAVHFTLKTSLSDAQFWSISKIELRDGNVALF